MKIIACSAMQVPSLVREPDVSLVISMHDPVPPKSPYRLMRLKGKATRVPCRSVDTVPQLWVETENFTKTGVDFMDHPVGQAILFTQMAARNGKGTVALHCQDGVFRAPTMAVAAQASLLMSGGEGDIKTAFLQAIDKVEFWAVADAERIEALAPVWWKVSQPYLANYANILAKR